MSRKRALELGRRLQLERDERLSASVWVEELAVRVGKGDGRERAREREGALEVLER